jgi:hypothetical protein
MQDYMDCLSPSHGSVLLLCVYIAHIDLGPITAPPRKLYIHLQ